MSIRTGWNMLENNNKKVCRRLVWREIRFHRLKTLLLAGAVTLVTCLYTFSFLLGSAIKESYLTNYQWSYGSASHILYYGLTRHQADALAGHSDVKSAVKLVSLGLLTDDSMGYRSVKLAVADEEYAASVLSVPTFGRMPQSPDEIALDMFTMDSLGIPHELGAAVSIRWSSDVDGRMTSDGQDGEEKAGGDNSGTSVHTDEFTLCGYWASAANFQEACAWITPKRAAMLFPGYDSPKAGNITLGVRLHQPKDLEQQAGRLIYELGLGEISYTTNLAYNEARRAMAENKALPYYLVNIVVVLCGFLMIYNIMNISVRRDIRLFGQAKALGMTPRQIRSVLYTQALWLCAMGIPLGWLMGFGLQLIIAPMLIIGADGNPALCFLRFWPFAASAGLAVATALAACVVPAKTACSSTPSEALNYVEGRSASGMGRRKDGGRTTLLRLAFQTIKRGKTGLVVSQLSLFLALTLLCCTYIKYISYDETLYLEGMALCDYLVADGSAGNRYQRYNPHSMSLTQDMAEELAGRPEVTQSGRLKTTEVSMKADEKLLETVSGYYNGKGSMDIPRRQEMEGYPEWSNGLERMEQEGEYTALIVGAEGLALYRAVETVPVNSGSYDPELFQTGYYVVTCGASSQDGVSTLPAGEKVVIEGREFTVMASVYAEPTLLAGNNSPQAQFSIEYYLPMDVYEELFPSSGIRQMMINVKNDPSAQKSFEAYLDGFETGLNRGIAVTRKSSLQETFRSGVISSTLAEFIVSAVLMMIGIINMANTLAARMLLRQKEFAVYESLGMTRAQLYRLVALEGLLHAGLLLAALIPLVGAVVWWGMPQVMRNMNTWCMVSRFSLAPLWILVPVLAVCAVGVPLACLRAVNSQSVVERMRIVE